MYPPQWAKRLTDPKQAFHAFYRWTWRYMQRMDMKTLRLMGVDPASIARVGRALPEVHFLMPDYGYQGEKAATGNSPIRLRPASRCSGP